MTLIRSKQAKLGIQKAVGQAKLGIQMMKQQTPGGLVDGGGGLVDGGKAAQRDRSPLSIGTSSMPQRRQGVEKIERVVEWRCGWSQWLC